MISKSRPKMIISGCLKFSYSPNEYAKLGADSLAPTLITYQPHRSSLVSRALSLASKSASVARRTISGLSHSEYNCLNIPVTLTDPSGDFERNGLSSTVERKPAQIYHLDLAH